MTNYLSITYGFTLASIFTALLAVSISLLLFEIIKEKHVKKAVIFDIIGLIFIIFGSLIYHYYRLTSKEEPFYLFIILGLIGITGFLFIAYSRLYLYKELLGIAHRKKRGKR